MGGWKEGRMEGKAGLRIAYSNQKEAGEKGRAILSSYKAILDTF